ncbi:hypothetical protein [Sphingomonas soli]|uniref:hypothetical protein n=1 Tax=Sphingomonas soli TaxID=266127 RepID=UPI00147032EB|nr:hypothetical protein [Sphingomonas soli]
MDPSLNRLMLSIAALAMFALVWGGVRQYRTDRTKGVLMLVCAVVLLGNLLIWTI